MSAETTIAKNYLNKAHGKVTAIEAKLKAEGEYESYRQIQNREYLSDFDKEIKRIQSGNNS